MSIHSFEQNQVAAFQRDKSCALLEKASEYFSSAPSCPRVICPLEGMVIPSIFRQIFCKFQHRGLCIGEFHGDAAPKRLLIDYCDRFVKWEIKTLFLENIVKEEVQKDLDRGLFSLRVQAALKKLDQKYHISSPDTYFSVVKKAVDAGLRVVALDTKASFYAGSNCCDFDESRISVFNYQAFEIIEQERGSGNFLILTGVNHGSQLRGSLIPGLSEMLQCAFVIVKDVRFAQEPTVLNQPTSKELRERLYRHEEGSVHSIIALS
ncbi:MAG TPA: hypothetical protein DCE71_02260 [Parachlamydiales bacterium]|nr:hypothetical protein [Parachlamydiales bacterium]